MNRSPLAALFALGLSFSLCHSTAADTTAFTIVDDDALDAAIAEVRAEFLATQSFDRLNACLLLPDGDRTWRRGAFNSDELQYPASCVKLVYMARAMVWARENGMPYETLDASVRPMIAVSDNVATGEVVDAISGVPNFAGNEANAPAFADWLEKRLTTERWLESRGLLGNQTILHKTYPTNSGNGLSGYEQQAFDQRGGNRMQARLSASLMLEIIEGAIEPEANAYMRELLETDRWSSDSAVGFGVVPGSSYQNKIGVAYDTLEDIAFIAMPNGQRLILTVFTNGWDTGEPLPYDAAPLGVFAEMLIERLGLDAGNPPKIKADDADAAVAYEGSWSTGTSSVDKFGASYAFAAGGSGATAAFDLNVPRGGLYEVAVWWPDGGNRATNAPFTVEHRDGSTTVREDQTERGGCWVRLGDFEFEARRGRVVVGTQGVSTSRVVMADAVKATAWPVAVAGTSGWMVMGTGKN
ncbi:MAG: serine hydrolase [Sumerlaeia bacterium]